MYRCNHFKCKKYLCVKKERYIDVINKYIGIVFTQRALNKKQKTKKKTNEEKKISK